MDQLRQKLTAFHVVNTLPVDELADLLYVYGGEYRSRRVAAVIDEARRRQPIDNTRDLAELVRSALGSGPARRARQRDAKYRRHRTHAATATFQALRIFVNDEFKALEKGLDQAKHILSSGGILAAISFHSGEDKIVKQFLQANSGQSHLPFLPQSIPTFRILNRKSIMPSKSEVASNPRSRSARLRLARKL